MRTGVAASTLGALENVRWISIAAHALLLGWAALPLARSPSFSRIALAMAVGPAMIRIVFF